MPEMTEQQIDKLAKLHTRLMDDLDRGRIDRADDLVREALIDGWNEGYRAGWVAARDTAYQAINNLKASGHRGGTKAVVSQALGHVPG